MAGMLIGIPGIDDRCEGARSEYHVQQQVKICIQVNHSAPANVLLFILTGEISH